MSNNGRQGVNIPLAPLFARNGPLKLKKKSHIIFYLFLLHLIF
jgi:hypothetical protein